jgi:uncharacterized membrane protein YhfC
MPGIYGMAVLTILLTGLLCIVTLHQLAHSPRRYVWLILVGLPLSLIVNRFIKTPLVTTLATWTGVPLKLGLEMPFWFILVIWLNAPIFEEAIKIFPILLPSSRRFLKDASQALWAGLALGMGFGLGEAAYLAYGIAQSPTYNQLPWYVFTGFASERLVVTFGHGLLTSLALLGLSYGRKKALFGYLTAVGLHAFINLGPVLSALKLIPLTVSSLGTYIAILIAFVFFQKNISEAKKIGGIEKQEIIYFER